MVHVSSKIKWIPSRAMFSLKLLCAFLLTIHMNGCANHDSELEEPMDDDEAETSAETPDAKMDAQAATTSNEIKDEDESDEETTEVDTNNPATTEAAPETAVAETPAVSEAPATPPAQVANVPAEPQSRVVRYVKADESAIYTGPSSSSASKKSLHRGDIVMVQNRGEFSLLDSGEFIKSKDLSEKGVGRKRAKTNWQSER